MRPERLRRVNEILQVINDFDYEGEGWTMEKDGWLMYKDLQMQHFPEFCIHPNLDGYKGCPDCKLNGCQIDTKTIQGHGREDQVIPVW